MMLWWKLRWLYSEDAGKRRKLVRYLERRIARALNLIAFSLDPLTMESEEQIRGIITGKVRTALAQLAKDPEEEVSAPAAAALRFFHENVAQLLVKELTSAPGSRSMARRLLPLIGSDAVPALIASASSIRDATVLLQTLDEVDPAWPHLESVRRAAPQLAIALFSLPAEDAVETAIRLQPLLRQAESIALVSAKLEDPAEHVRSKATRLLAALGAVTEVPALVRVLNTDAYELRLAAAHALGELNWDPAGEDAILYDLLRGEMEAVAARGKAAVPVLAHCVHNRDALLRQQAVKALGALRVAKATQMLVRALADRDKSVASEAAEALARHGPSVRERLFALLHDPGGRGSEFALQTLLRMGDPNVMKELLEQLSRSPAWLVVALADHIRFHAGDIGEQPLQFAASRLLEQLDLNPDLSWEQRRTLAHSVEYLIRHHGQRLDEKLLQRAAKRRDLEWWEEDLSDDAAPFGFRRRRYLDLSDLRNAATEELNQRKRGETIG